MIYSRPPKAGAVAGSAKGISSASSLSLYGDNKGGHGSAVLFTKNTRAEHSISSREGSRNLSREFTLKGNSSHEGQAVAGGGERESATTETTVVEAIGKTDSTKSDTVADAVLGSSKSGTNVTFAKDLGDDGSDGTTDAIGKAEDGVASSAKEFEVTEDEKAVRSEMRDSFTLNDEPWVPLSDAGVIAEGNREEIISNDLSKLSESSLVMSSKALLRLPDGSIYFDEVFRKSSLFVQAGHTTSIASKYSSPAAPNVAAELLHDGGGGLIWHAMVLADNDKAFLIKARRPISQVRASDLFSSLTKTPDNRWIFTGVLNGWPGLQCLEVREITCKHHWLSLSVFGYYLLPSGHSKEKTVWSSESNPKNEAPKYPTGETGVRITFRGAPWTSRGWTEGSPGFMWWFSPQRPSSKRFTWGANSARCIEAYYRGLKQSLPNAVRVHHVGHRFAKGKGRRETAKDKLIYHGLNVIEWDHGSYVTVVELAALNGHQRNRCLFHKDRDAAAPELIKCMHPNMITPWRTEFSEYRVSDLPNIKNFEQFKKFVADQTGNEYRFIDPCYADSSDVVLDRCSEVDVARYLNNYMRRDTRYHLENRNCQSAAADLFGFMTGKDTKPISSLARQAYHPKREYFIYKPSQFKPIMPKGY